MIDNEMVETLDGIIQILYIKSSKDEELKVMADGLLPLLNALTKAMHGEAN